MRCIIFRRNFVSALLKGLLIH